MAIVVECESCRGKFRAPDGSQGRKGRCPKCGEAVEVPMEMILLDPEPEKPAERGRPEAKPRPAGRKLRVVAYGSTAILAAGLATAWWAGLFEPNHRRLGNMANQRGDYEAAEGHYRRAIKAHQGEDDLSYDHEGLGNALCGMKDYANAISEYEEAIRLSYLPTKIEQGVTWIHQCRIHEELGIAEIFSGEIDKGLDHIAEGIQIVEQSAGQKRRGDHHIKLANYCQQLKKFDRAIGALQVAYERYQRAENNLGMAECCERRADICKITDPDDQITQDRFEGEARRLRESHNEKYGIATNRYDR